MIVITLNHFPIHVLEEGTTMEQAQLHCTLLSLEHMRKSHIMRQYCCHDVEVIPAKTVASS